jgi:hypothetical protein
MTTTLHYRKYIFMYGILTIIFVLERLEKLEEYEECQKIIDAIREQENRLDIKLFTKFSKECLTEVIETYKKFNLTGENVIENSNYYADLIMQELKEIQL